MPTSGSPFASGQPPFGGGVGGGLDTPPDTRFDACQPLVKNNVVLRNALKYGHDVEVVVACWTRIPFIGMVAGVASFIPLSFAGLVVGLVMAPLAKLIASAGTLILELLGEARKEAAPELNEVITATMNEMFGTECSAADLPTKGDFNAARSALGRSASES